MGKQPKRKHKLAAGGGGSQHCNYCYRLFSNIPGKKYCEHCDKGKYKECKTCHLPLPSKQCFELDEHRCNKCEARYQASKLKRLQKKEAKLGGKAAFCHP
jgi:uncharacterized paraquat-inducible protein A